MTLTSTTALAMNCPLVLGSWGYTKYATLKAAPNSTAVPGCLLLPLAVAVRVAFGHANCRTYLGGIIPLTSLTLGTSSIVNLQ
ncbi:hypothetical protein FB451DRAFT_1282696 [Mycena latifolia]|nr:hypothetical protein FB451DRAFT_1282696 [Mycena latifolia]